MSYPFPKNIRAPHEYYANPDFRFHIVIRLHPELPSFSADQRRIVWDLVLQQRTARRVQLFAACLMPDHVHLLVAPTEVDVIRFVDAWKSFTTRRSWSAQNHHGFWQPGWWDRTIRDEADFHRTVEYILRNPVDAGLAGSAREWRWNWAWYWDDTEGGADSAIVPG